MYEDLSMGAPTVGPTASRLVRVRAFPPGKGKGLEGSRSKEPTQTYVSIVRRMPVIIHNWSKVFCVEEKGSYKLFSGLGLDKKNSC